MLRLVTKESKAIFELDCEDCGYKISKPLWYGDLEPEYVQCSSCAREEYIRWRQTRDAKENRKPADLPAMTKIDTRDLPGFVRDNAARRVAEQLALFGKKR
jgi:hypothetical protein